LPGCSKYNMPGLINVTPTIILAKSYVKQILELIPDASAIIVHPLNLLKIRELIKRLPCANKSQKRDVFVYYKAPLCFNEHAFISMIFQNGYISHIQIRNKIERNISTHKLRLETIAGRHLSYSLNLSASIQASGDALAWMPLIRGIFYLQKIPHLGN